MINCKVCTKKIRNNKTGLCGQHRYTPEWRKKLSKPTGIRTQRKNCLDCGDEMSRRTIYDDNAKWCQECFNKNHSSQHLVGTKPWNYGDFSKTGLRLSIRHLVDSKNWRVAVFERDNYTCQDCGQIGGKLNADHIKKFSHIISDNRITNLDEAKECSELWDLENGRTLCFECHLLTPNFGRRDNRTIYA